MKRALQAVTSSAKQPSGSLNPAHLPCYTADQIVGLLQISLSGFFKLKRRGQLPFLEELRPRLGRVVRYRADLVDRYLAGQWEQPRALRHARQCGSAQQVSSST